MIRLALALALAASGSLATVSHAEPVPDVALSPAVAEAAPAVDAPIAEVTVFSDRARIRRRGRLPSRAGAATAAVIRLPDLPGAAFLDTVRVVASSGRVLRVEATPVERERLTIEQATKLLDALDAVNDRLAEVDDRAAADEAEAALLAGLRPAPPVPEEKREGRKALAVDVPSWGKALDFVGERVGRARERLVRIADERRGLLGERQRLLAELGQLGQGGFSSRVIRVVAIVERPPAGEPTIELEYFVPGARWKPAYDLHFAPARGQLRVETAAVVEQSTGEDWPASVLLLSTAIPGRGIDAPELLTWTLGERSEFIPQLRPRSAPRFEPPFPPPVVAPSVERAQVVAAEVVQERLARAMQASSEHEEYQIARLKSVADEAAPARPQGHYNLARSRPSPSPSRSYAGSAAPAAAPAMEMMAESDYADAAPMSAPSAPMRTASDKSVSTGRALPLALYDASSPRPAPSFSDAYLPAVSAGGLDYVYTAPTAAAVPSSGQAVRIPLAAQTFTAAAFHEATPALATTAFLRARVRNDGKRPLLRGPATIFSDGELVGIGEIQTTGPGGDIEFPLGADQDVRLVRQVVPSTRTTGLIMKSEETTYDVKLQVGNYKKQKVVVELRDQVPRSRQDKVEVKVIGTDPAPVAAPDADGVVRWRVELAPGTTRTVQLRYQITRPKGWTLFQR